MLTSQNALNVGLIKEGQNICFLSSEKFQCDASEVWVDHRRRVLYKVVEHMAIFDENKKLHPSLRYKGLPLIPTCSEIQQMFENSQFHPLTKFLSIYAVASEKMFVANR